MGRDSGSCHLRASYFLVGVVDQFGFIRKRDGEVLRLRVHGRVGSRDRPRGHQALQAHGHGRVDRASVRVGVFVDVQGDGEQERGVQELPGHGVLRHARPPRDPPQRPREPGLVHAVHAVPGGDLAGPPRVPPQLPDHDQRPHRAPHGERVAPRRGHRGGGGDDHVQRHQPREKTQVPRQR